MILSTSSNVLAARTSAASFWRFWPTISDGSRTSCKKVWATQATRAMMLALMSTAGKALWNKWKPESTAGREQSANRQKIQKHVIVPMYFVSASATFLLNRW